MSTAVSVLIATVECRTRVRVRSIDINDAINDAPNTCSFLMDGAAPTDGQAVRIIVNSVLLFNGKINGIALTYEKKNTNIVYRVSAIDDTGLLNNLRPFGTWSNVSATTVITALVASFAPTFTVTHVAAALPAVSVIFDGSEGFSKCLSQIMGLIGGYWYVEDLDVHAFITEASSTPDAIDNTAGRFLNDPPITRRSDLSQLRTRVYGRGYGSTVTTAVAPGAVKVPVDDRAFFSSGGGSAIAGSNRLTYTGIGPPAAPVVLDWTVPPNPTTVRGWYDVVWAASLGLFVAVSGPSFTDGVMTSPDGKTWTNRTCISNTWNCVAWSPTLGLLVAGADNGSSVGAIMTSPDGITWTSRTYAASTSGVYGIAWSPTLNLFVAVGGAGNTNHAATSPDGITWTARTVPALNWQGVVWADTLNLFVAIASSGGGSAAMTSPDGITWTQRTTPANGGLAIAWSSTLGKLVTVSSPPLYSTNGTTWTAAVAPSTNAWNTVVWAEGLGMFIALSYTSTGSDNRIMASTDGITWTAQNAPTVSDWFGVAWSPALSRLVAVSHGGANQIIIADVPAVLPGMLTGVPTSGAGSVVTAIAAGDAINIWIQRDDATAQAAYGIIEYVVQDERRNLVSLTALCDANLALYKNPIVTVTYACRDYKSKSGKTVTVNITTPFVMSEVLTIQQVTITEIDVAPMAPRFTVTASTVRFSLEDMLRTLLAAA